MTRRTRFVAPSVVSGSLLAIGLCWCLFPSFADLLGSEVTKTVDGGESRRNDGATNEPLTGDGAATTDGTVTSPQDDGGTTKPDDSGADTAGPRLILCGSQTCNLDTSDCCVSAASSSCTNNVTPTCAGGGTRRVRRKSRLPTGRGLLRHKGSRRHPLLVVRSDVYRPHHLSARSTAVP
jgi:hypothetical protein